MPSPFGGQINSLMDMVVQQPQQPAAAPPRQYGSFDQDQAYYMQPSPPLYSGGGVSGIGGGGGGGIGAFSPPQDLARYFSDGANPRIDDPRQVAADAGISVSQLASGFLPRYQGANIGYEYPSDKGGFFTVEDLFGLSGTPKQRPPMGGMMDPTNPPRNVQTYREGAIPVPSIASYGQQLPSTNNWRLLGMGPGWIMRNGNLINTRAIETTRGGYLGADMGEIGGSAEMGAHIPNYSALGTGVFAGMPNNWRGATGWPGQATPYIYDRWPYQTNV